MITLSAAMSPVTQTSLPATVSEPEPMVMTAMFFVAWVTTSPPPACAG
ncbi:MAG: hypothetical protein ABJE95_03055 [Byssovorax sp.]